MCARLLALVALLFAASPAFAAVNVETAKLSHGVEAWYSPSSRVPVVDIQLSFEGAARRAIPPARRAAPPSPPTCSGRRGRHGRARLQARARRPGDHHRRQRLRRPGSSFTCTHSRTPRSAPATCWR
ncbi:MAG: hypothetical protein WDN72_10790 [Alphaproteobacteria bacterium]